MANTAATYPGIVATQSVDPEWDKDWTNPDYVKADDTNYAYVANILGGGYSYRLKCTNFGFALPAGSTIDGIVVEIHRYETDASLNVVDYRVQLLNAVGALVGDNKASATEWPTSLTTRTYGGAADTWGASPTEAMVEDADFGVVLSIYRDSNLTERPYVDYIRMTIYYTVGPTTYELSCTDGLKVGDTPTESMVANVLCTDGFKSGDAPTNLSTMLASAADGLKLGDSTIFNLAYYLSLIDGLKVGDSSSLAAMLAVIDGLKVSDTPAESMLASLQVSDGVKLGDLPSLIAMLTATDGVKFGDFPQDWRKRIKIDIDQTNISGEVNFPIYVPISTASGIGDVDVSCIFDEVGDNYKKIAVTTSDGFTQCKVEVVSWSAASEYAELWVKVPIPSEGFIYIYYDNSHADNDAYVGLPGSTPAKAVWDDNFVFVSHMNDNPDTSHIKDSTQYGNDGTKKGANEPLEVAGLVGKAQSFDGANDYIRLPNVVALNLISQSDFTIEMFPKLDTSESSDLFYQYAVANLRLVFRWAKAEGFYYTCYDASNALVINIYKSWLPTNGQYYQITLRRSGNAHDIFIDSVSLGTITDADRPGNDVDTSYVSSTLSTAMKGLIDEIRISSIARSADWIAATNQTLTDALLTFGAEEILVITMQAYPTLNDGIKVGDSPLESLLATVQATDGIKIGDLPLLVAMLVASDGLKIGDSILANMLAYPTSTDGLKVGDTSLISMLASLLSTDGLKVGDTPLATMLANVQISDGIKFGDLALAYLTIRLLVTKYIVEIHDSSGNLAAVLNKAFGINYTQAVNEAPTLDFQIPADDEKVADIVRPNEIWLRNYNTGAIVRKFRLITRRDRRE